MSVASTPLHNEASKLDHNETSKLSLKIPVVHLESRTISDEMAAILSISLLGHTLFLKNQIPFPVQQLARMPAPNASNASNKKAVKKRVDFGDAFDELSSHLHTTFTALSTAFARNVARYPSLQTDDVRDVTSEIPSARAYLSVVLGPTVGTPKARVMLVIDGLEVKVWGIRDDLEVSSSKVGEMPPEEDGGNGQESDSEDFDEDCEDSESEVSDLPDGDDDEEEEEEEDSDDSKLDGEDDLASGSDEQGEPEEPPSDPPPESQPPQSSALSPLRETTNTPRVPFQGHLTNSPCSQNFSPATRYTPRAPSQQHPTSSPCPQNCYPTAQFSITSSKPYLVAPQSKTYAEQQQILRNATNLLSRQLINACAEGNGMACEMAPTQAHILLRAPRRFAHPAWLPRQNLTSSLDTMLSEFLHDSGVCPSSSIAAKSRRKGGVKTEGVYVGCQSEGAAGGEEGLVGDEDDEMIWWAWNGRLSGFSEW
ncbi:hypothetical protein EW146_g3247 [Bondarzewia mesenterica]|uniref:Uncharacterized protein n=1 Tax=Bondarzewia mesenterica TaxID=1095465 RepID=A0A4S4LY44_9AGAM|nr:hypothetical protein EW146_g3247 [Bondarzewia mesenterica]